MFEGERGSEAAFEGQHIQSLSRPRVPILIGGGGERKTLRLVAQYADACNVFGDPEDLVHKLEVLRAHCDAVGRPFDEIERTTLQPANLFRAGWGRSRQTPAQIVERAGQLAEAGAQHVILGVQDVHEPATLDLVAEQILPHLRSLP